MQRTSSPQLAVNFVPVRFSADHFVGGLVQYESGDQLKSLRAELEGTHVVSKTRGGIACVPLVADADLCGTPTTFAIREYRRLTMRLVQETMLRSVLDWGYKLRRCRPPTFVSRLPGKDLLAQAVGGRGPDTLGSLHVFPQWVLDCRAEGPSNRPGIVIGLKTRYEIDMTVAELIEAGISVEGLYVLAEDSAGEPSSWMDPYASRRNAGAIDHIDGTDLVLRDAPEIGRVPASEAWLEGRRETFTTVMASLAGADAPRMGVSWQPCKSGRSVIRCPRTGG
ncbi:MULTISPECIES: hypothetical protein [Nocardia]|uniref:hypothetical protein n=1 Tax=Nocardia TaxID=1817 RepID=UPI0007E9F6A1|nr:MULTISPECIES: hypothetical protein [Nocardia]MBF6276736.1 hypothetical protein [Nocardia nova]OBB47499.1 hypothetical protein A5748_22625 [Nocardia sp. 852002-51244_SCH5132740]OBF87190.1 hypothetical protein A9X06_11100 [Mycobacterium sp. 852002-51759_SCH5129042]